MLDSTNAQGLFQKARQRPNSTHSRQLHPFEVQPGAFRSSSGSYIYLGGARKQRQLTLSTKKYPPQAVLKRKVEALLLKLNAGNAAAALQEPTQGRGGVQQKVMRHENVATTMNVYGKGMMDGKLETHTKLLEYARVDFRGVPGQPPSESAC